MTPSALLERGHHEPSATVAPAGSGWADPRRAQVAVRLAELAALREDWDGYGARRLDHDALRLADDVLEDMMQRLPLLPDIFPVPDGGVQLEWEVGPVELELELEPGGRSAIFICQDRISGQRFDGELPADDGLLRIALARLNAHA